MIQETHIPSDQQYTKNDYCVIKSAATPNPKHPESDIAGRNIAGVEIAIRRELSHRISTVDRINHRIPKVTLDHEDTHAPVTILVT